MSGTSLDGLDLVLCSFEYKGNDWEFDIIKHVTCEYSKEWKNILSGIKYETPAFEYLKIDQEYGRYIGNRVNEFMKGFQGTIDCIASHGHTIFHQPPKGITSQIGNGNNIASTTGFCTITDFRSMDVAFGGHGAPLVPVGDMLLFPGYKFCLNLGGFANISVKENGSIKAFDICPVNILLNGLVADIDLAYDQNGEMGRKGTVHFDLLKELDNLDFYQRTGPKSLGREWLDEFLLPVIYKYNLSIEDKLRTVYEHIVNQTIKVLGNNKDDDILITGGGAKNKFLIELYYSRIKQNIVLPDQKIIDFKEALIFAFLGVLRLREEVNCLSEVTGAEKNTSGGAIYFPGK